MEEIFFKMCELLVPDKIEHILLHEGIVTQYNPPDVPLQISIGNVVPHSMKILSSVYPLSEGEKVLILSDDKYERFYCVGKIGGEV